jgi:hypothetical protein
MSLLPTSILLAGLLIVATQATAEPPTAVTCGDTITAPGQYRLSADCAGAGIAISASHVNLELDGHTMTGKSTVAGIFGNNVTDVDIRGPGTITAYGAAFLLPGVTNSQVVNVTCVRNHVGLELSVSSTGNRIVNSVFDNGFDGPGILLGPGSNGNHIDQNEVNGNSTVGGGGITLDVGATGNQIHGNTAFGNIGPADLEDDNPNCDSNNWDGNHFGTAVPSSCIN